MIRLAPFFVLSCMLLAAAGCAAIPDVVHEPRVHNPFPQLTRVAVLPFYNLSNNPSVHADDVSLAYFGELQKIPGFEVMPPGTARKKLEAAGVDLPSLSGGGPREARRTATARQASAEDEPPRFEPQQDTDFQKLARLLEVDAVVVGAVTDYTPYYPPRLGLAVNWYAGNPGFHAIPAGYGLPWGTEAEEYIPSELVYEAEFALAREQLKTQTPRIAPAVTNAGESDGGAGRAREVRGKQKIKPAAHQDATSGPPAADGAAAGADGVLPADWPDPRGFVPPQPSPVRPASIPFAGPVMSQVRLYDGADAGLTERLANYYYLRDDARFAGWQTYLARSDDFLRFCCHLHIGEMLAARGGADATRVVWRWPVGRYER